MRVGFTGTRSGTTDQQYRALGDWIQAQQYRHWLGNPDGPAIAEGHHGCCVGADDDFDLLCVQLLVPVYAHPADVPAALRAKPRSPVVVFPPKPPLERNRDIVAACEVLLACPGGMAEEQRSGTWATVRQARKAGRPVVIFWPDGRVEDQP